MNIVKEETRYIGPAFNVVTKTLQQLPFSEPFKRDVVVAPRCVAIVPISLGSVTLVRQYRAPVNENVFEIPAGKIDPGESIAQAARRELKEELGYTGGQWMPLGHFYPSPGISDETIAVVLALDCQPGDTDRQGPEEQQMTTVIMSLEAAMAKIKEAVIVDAKTIIGLNWAAKMVR